MEVQLQELQELLTILRKMRELAFRMLQSDTLNSIETKKLKAFYGHFVYIIARLDEICPPVDRKLEIEHFKKLLDLMIDYYENVLFTNTGLSTGKKLHHRSG